MNGIDRKIRGLSWCLVATAFVFSTEVGAADKADPLARLRALEGEWVAASDGEMVKKGDLVSRYEVTAGGFAVLETEFPGTDHEMVTLYTAEGEDLVLTHYCIAGNQPRMRARETGSRRIEFNFDGGGNISDPSRDRHMHSAWLEIVGPDEIRSEWTELAEGEPALVVNTHLVRKKR